MPGPCPIWELEPTPNPFREESSCAPTRPIVRDPVPGRCGFHLGPRLLSPAFLQAAHPSPLTLAKPAPTKRASSAFSSSRAFPPAGACPRRGLSGVSAEWLFPGPRLVGVLGGSSEQSPENPTPPPPPPLANRSHALPAGTPASRTTRAFVGPESCCPPGDRSWTAPSRLAKEEAQGR